MLYKQQDPDGVTAFRVAEKQYQLHKQEQGKTSQGKRRARGVVVLPTDTSAVVDPTSPSDYQRHQVTCVEVDGQRAVLFARHPGLCVYPGALTAAQQLQIASDALRKFPDPPSCTNHTAHHGGVWGLWDAAQASQRLALPVHDAAGTPATAPATAPATPADWLVGSSSSSTNSRGAGGSSAVEVGAAGAASTCVAVTSGSVGGSSCRAELSPCTCEQTCCSEHGKLLASVDVGPDRQAQWVADGAGPPAKQLLQKLRWAALGPNFNWSQRVYEYDTPFSPLPPYLCALAQRFATSAAAVLATAQGPAPSSSAHGSKLGGAGVQPAGTGHQQGPAQPLAAGPATAAAAAGAGARQTVEAAPAAIGYQPDAALVNYYRQGDTLGGHRDDVEADMTHPIVSLSVGCDAVFLMGGPTRLIPPTALWLRSGDVVVMAGSARTCFHGVPRIFTDHPLPPALRAVAEGLSAGLIAVSPEERGQQGGGTLPMVPAALELAGGCGSGCAPLGPPADEAQGAGLGAGWRAVLDALRGMRINVSIRHTRCS